MSLDLLSDLDIQNVTGIIVLTVYIDDSETIIGFKIMKMRVEKDGVRCVSFSNESQLKKSSQKGEYPKEVQTYYATIDRYVDCFVYKRDENIPLEELNKLTFMVRLK